jgi:hypothetical protein
MFKIGFSPRTVVGRTTHVRGPLIIDRMIDIHPTRPESRHEYLLMVRPYASPRQVGTMTAITDTVVSRTMRQLRPRGASGHGGPRDTGGLMTIQAPVQGRWVDGVVGLDDVQVDVAMVRTSDRHGRLELMKFHTAVATIAEPNAPANPRYPSHHVRRPGHRGQLSTLLRLRPRGHHRCAVRAVQLK